MILFASASSIGTPICTDVTTNRPKFDSGYGYFVRVLVDVDLKHDLMYMMLVEMTVFAFFI